MKVTFSLNQVSLIKLNASRYGDVYDVVRSYEGIPVGVLFTVYDFIDVWRGATFTKYLNEDGIECVSIRSVEYDFKVILHSAQCEVAYINMAEEFNSLNFSCARAARLVRHYKSMIDDTEW